MATLSFEGALNGFSAPARSLKQALETGYAAFGDRAYADAVVEGIAAFDQRRAPDFVLTG